MFNLAVYQGVEVEDAMKRLDGQFRSFQGANSLKYRYYDGKQRFKDLGISIPPSMRDIESVVGWPGIAVDVLDERLDFEGWSNSDLEVVFRRNNLDVNAPMVHQDALITGTSFVTVTSGLEGEPDPLISAVPPTEMVATRSRRTGLVTEACQFYVEDDENKAILFRPNYNLWLVKGRGGWKIEEVDEHNLRRVQVAQMINRPRSSHPNGRSEITPAVRGYTDSALRTLVGAEVAREFYAVPQRWMMGAPEEFFLDENGNQRGAWDAMMGKILAVEDGEESERPEVGQFTAHDMKPFFDQLKGLAEQFAAEVSISPTYVGVQQVNPASADAIRMSENRLVKRAERRQDMFGKGWSEVAVLSYMVRDGRLYEDLTDDELTARPLWRDPSTPTRAATADEVLKMVSAGVYTPEGEYTMKRLGLDPDDRAMLKRDRASSITGALRRLTEQQVNQVSPEAQNLGSNNPPNVSGNGVV